MRDGVAAIRRQVWSVAGQSERTLLLGTCLLAFTFSGAVSYVLAQYYSIDVLSSVYAQPQDCIAPWGMGIGGRHCFGDYPIIGSLTQRSNPWDPVWLPLGGPPYRPLRNEYPAAAMTPHLLFWTLGNWFGSPQLGLLIALIVLTVAVLTPAVWAVRGARGVERVVVFMVCGAVAFPAWLVVDRGNSVGLLAPISLGFLLALSKRRWRVVAVVVMLGALVKPQFAVLVVVLFMARHWRLGALTVAGVLVTNIAAYLLWPNDFPGTIGQSIHNVLGYTAWGQIWSWDNVSFAGGLMFAGRTLARAVGVHGEAMNFLNHPGLVVGYVILAVFVGSLVALGRRMDPVMAGIVLLATASLFPPLSYSYYLVFALPVAALVVRHPDGPPNSGMFDRLVTLGDQRRAVGICTILSVAISIVGIPMPYRSLHAVTLAGSTIQVVPTAAILAPLAWLITCSAIIVSYARRPALHDEAKTVSGG
ncbi:MAG: DUF2029 domain-containing protein [Mycolicibacterium sp.]|nr:DUF2029 domain-containing protein [Mycolicibacterium sp.]